MCLFFSFLFFFSLYGPAAFVSFLCARVSSADGAEKRTIRQDGCAELSCAFDGTEIELLGSQQHEKTRGQKAKEEDETKKKTQPRDRRKDVAQKRLSEGAQFLPGNPRGFCIDTIKLVNRSLSLSSCPQKKFLFKQRDLFLLCERTKNLKKEKYSKKRVAYWVLASGRQRPNMSSLFHG